MSYLMDEIYGISLNEWLYKHKLADIECDIKLLKNRLHQLVYEEADVALINEVKYKLEQKEKLLKRVKQWYMNSGKN